jgi:flavin reductase (DIM6/NTAB) family NADH-FMN oxidoreductase RutF
MTSQSGVASTTGMPQRPELAQPTAAFAGFPSGVAALCGVVNGVPRGMVASSFAVGVSFEPALALFSVQKTSTTWPALRLAERIGVSVLGEQHGDLCRQLASRRDDRFAGVDIFRGGHGDIYIPCAPVWLECSAFSETPAGDHCVVVLQVHASHVDPARQPLVYHRKQFRRLAT